jgi:hypothetical protein
MTTIITRAGKGSHLTYDETDENFNNLNDDKLEIVNDLSEVNAAIARTNLGLGSMSTQNSDNVSITGGFLKSQSVADSSLAINLTKLVL